MSITSIVSKVAYQSYVNQTVGRRHTAYLIGITSSMNSVSRLSSPIVVGYLMEGFSMATTLYCSSFCVLVASVLFIVVGCRESTVKSKTE